MADLAFHIESNRDCDSVFFGKDFSSIGIIYKDKELYSVLLESNSKIFLTTLYLNGHTIDKIELVQNNGVINDSLSIWSTYQLQKDNSFLQQFIQDLTQTIKVNRIEKPLVSSMLIEQLC